MQGTLRINQGTFRSIQGIFRSIQEKKRIQLQVCHTHLHGQLHLCYTHLHGVSIITVTAVVVVSNKFFSAMAT
jgi:hypothetical protein